MFTMRLDGKVAFITGAASGIGKGIAECYAAAGANVVIADLNLEAAKTVAQEIAQTYGVKTLSAPVDVTDENAVNKAIDETVSVMGRIDIVNANAGIQIIQPFVDFDYRVWKKIMDIHVGGSFLTARAAMKHMINAGTPGRIIVTGSVHSFEASKDKAAYVTAKHGLLGMVRAIAKEGAAHNITANLIAPGFVKTPLVEKQIPEQAKSLGISEEEVVKKIMLGDTIDGMFTTIEDVARVSLFFASHPNNALSGQSLIISHGWHMQ